MEQQKRHIVDTLNALGKYWLARPELRLGQIISNAFRAGDNYREEKDLFYSEDKEIIEGLKILVKNEIGPYK